MPEAVVPFTMPQALPQTSAVLVTMELHDLLLGSEFQRSKLADVDRLNRVRELHVTQGNRLHQGGLSQACWWQHPHPLPHGG